MPRQLTRNADEDSARVTATGMRLRPRPLLKPPENLGAVRSPTIRKRPRTVQNADQPAPRSRTVQPRTRTLQPAPRARAVSPLPHTTRPAPRSRTIQPTPRSSTISSSRMLTRSAAAAAQNSDTGLARTRSVYRPPTPMRRTRQATEADQRRLSLPRRPPRMVADRSPTPVPARLRSRSGPGPVQGAAVIRVNHRGRVHRRTAVLGPGTSTGEAITASLRRYRNRDSIYDSPFFVTLRLENREAALASDLDTVQFFSRGKL
uniref:RING-type domain-containing protein n=1 Tax=Steinernema glaseri TaxID=37863 RepID=A0A1I7ZWS8_9BILA